MWARSSARSSGTPKAKRCSLRDPVGPPSALVPLSEMARISVSSSTPSASRKRHQAPDVVVGVAEEAGEHLLHPGVEAALLGGQVVPRPHPARPLGQRGAGGHDPVLDLAGEGPLPPPLPAVVEPAAVPVDPLGRRLVRGVHGAGGEVEEEGPVGSGVAAGRRRCGSPGRRGPR